MKDALKEIGEHLILAYDLTKDVPARGLELDRLAAARQELRLAHQVVEKAMKEEDGHGG